MKHTVNSFEVQKKKNGKKINENENKKWIKEMKTVLRDKIKYQYFINIKK